MNAGKEQDEIHLLLITKANRLEGLRESRHIVNRQNVVHKWITKGTSKGGHQGTYDSTE